MAKNVLYELKYNILLECKFLIEIEFLAKLLDYLKINEKTKELFVKMLQESCFAKNNSYKGVFELNMSCLIFLKNEFKKPQATYSEKPFQYLEATTLKLLSIKSRDEN